MHDVVRYLPSRLAGVEAMHARTRRSYPRHTHDQYGIGLIDAGGHVSASDRRQVTAGPGQLIFVNPGEVHDGRPLGDGGRTWRMLYFDPAQLAECMDDCGATDAGEFAFTAPVFTHPRLRRCFDTAFDAVTNGNTMAAETALLNLAAALRDHASGANRRRTPMPPIRHALNRIADSPELPLSLHELASEAGISRYQLIRGFQRDLGLSPHRYILQQRLALARRLIRAGRPLAEVATMAGFCDQSHLHRCFRAQFGVTPYRYARHGE